MSSPADPAALLEKGDALVLVDVQNDFCEGDALDAGFAVTLIPGGSGAADVEIGAPKALEAMLAAGAAAPGPGPLSC